MKSWTSTTRNYRRRKNLITEVDFHLFLFLIKCALCRLSTIVHVGSVWPSSPSRRSFQPSRAQCPQAIGEPSAATRAPSRRGCGTPGARRSVGHPPRRRSILGSEVGKVLGHRFPLFLRKRLTDGIWNSYLLPKTLAHLTRERLEPRRTSSGMKI